MPPRTFGTILTSTRDLDSTLKPPRLQVRWRLRCAAVMLSALGTAASLGLSPSQFLRAGTAVTATAFWLLPAPVARAATTGWFVSDPLAPGDAVLVLGGGFHRRARAAATLYQRGLAPQVLVAQLEREATVSTQVGPSESDRSRTVLLAAGVPESAIAPFGEDVASTFDEARATAKWASTHGAQHVIVPTDWYHINRVRWIFRALAPPGVRVSVIALPPVQARADFRDWSSLTTIAEEAVKYYYYRLRYYGAVRETAHLPSSYP